MNERPYYFEWEKIVEYYNDGKSSDIYSIIDKKIEMGREFILNYMMYINMICCYKWYDDYKGKTGKDYINNEALYAQFNSAIRNKIEKELSEILKQYYYKNYDNNVVTKRMDSILNYYLEKHHEVIEKRLDVINVKNQVETIIKFVIYISAISDEKIIEGKGAELAKDTLKTTCFQAGSNHNKTGSVKRLEDYLTEALEPLFRKLSMTEKKYLEFLITNTFKQGSKITKNDASDYYILSAGDLIKRDNNNNKLVVITYDKKMKKFLEENHIYYDKDVYDKIYNNK